MEGHRSLSLFSARLSEVIDDLEENPISRCLRSRFECEREKGGLTAHGKKKGE